MEIESRLISYSIGIAILVIVGFFIKKMRIIPEESASMVLAKIIVNIALPCMIFGNLAVSKISISEFRMPGIVLIIEICSMFLAYFAGKAFHLPRAKIGSLILVAAFGNMSALGVSVIDSVYNHNTAAIAKAVISSELGNQLFLQTIGILIAFIFGASQDKLNLKSIAYEFFFNPPTIAIFLGLSWSFLDLPNTGLVLSPIFMAIQKGDMMLADLVSLLIGFSLRRVDFLLLLRATVIIVVLGLIFKPFATYGFSRLVNLSPFDTNILVILMSMPSAALNVPIARKYGCDAELAASLTIISISFSIVTVFLITILM